MTHEFPQIEDKYPKESPAAAFFRARLDGPKWSGSHAVF